MFVYNFAVIEKNKFYCQSKNFFSLSRSVLYQTVIEKKCNVFDFFICLEWWAYLTIRRVECRSETAKTLCEIGKSPPWNA